MDGKDRGGWTQRMSFFTHTATWTKGEMLEAALTVGIGLLTIGVALACWWLGQTPAAKAVLIPFSLVGAILVVGGASGYLGNQKRLPEFEKNFHGNPTAFVKAEKDRVEGFQYLYTITLVLSATCFLLASVIFWWTQNLHWRAAGIALVFLGLSGLVVDYFSKDRADSYYEAIRAELAASSAGVRLPSD